MVQLSYIIATRNRLPFLRITLSKLLETVLPDEEIVVVDGNSTDGSKEYLQDLFQQGRIQQFLSEPDQNQAHAWNKAMLLAKGTLIKKIIDDDVFCYSAIRKCKEYMLQHQDVEVMLSDDLSSSLTDPGHITQNSRLQQFLKWKGGLISSFTFSDVHILIRRSVLSRVGLYNISFIMMDWEYALRISHLKTKITYYTGYNALNVAHPQTVTTRRNIQLVEEQGKLGMLMYDYAGDRAEISNWSKLKIMAGKVIYGQKATGKETASGPENLPSVYTELYDRIEAINQTGSFEFIKST